MTKRILASFALTGALVALAFPATPASADGAASTRNIILGGAAAAAGTLILINHNKQVHAKEDQMANAQAAAEENANNAQAAYAAERRAYAAQVAINGEYKREVAVQHSMIVQLRGQLAQSDRARARAAAVASRATASAPDRSVATTTSMGWGSL